VGRSRCRCSTCFAVVFFQPSKHRGLLAADDSLLELEGYEDDPDEERADIARLVAGPGALV
jgi:hypothetical protein